MPIEVRIEGAAKLHKVAAQIREEGRKDLGREMSQALAYAVEPVKTSIRESAGQTMPHEGGYQVVFDKSLNFKTPRNQSANSAKLKLLTFADGTSERRDIRSLEAGKLRHPVFGRSRGGARKGERIANPWAVTSIRPGFHKRGTARAINEAQDRLETVLDRLADRLID